MYGLAADQWRDLLLSVNVHRKERRLSPIQAALHLKSALTQTDVDSLAQSLGFTDSTTFRKILRLADLPDDVAALVDWGTHRGSVSMSTAAELMRLGSPALVRKSIFAAVEHSLTRDEARQVVQIRERSGNPLDECIASALRTRPRIERSELIIGSFVSDRVAERVMELGNEEATRKLKRLVAMQFPDVICKGVRVNGRRFSLLLAEEEARKLRMAVGDASVEETITRLLTK